MNPTDVGIVFRKEITDLLRDRRSVIATLILPIMLFPILLYGSSRLEELRNRKLSNEPVMVALSGSIVALEKRIDEDPLLQLIEVGDLTAALNAGEIHAGLILPGNLPRPADPPADLTLLYDESEELSGVARERIREHLTAWRKELQEERLEAIEASPGIMNVLEVEEINVASEEKMAGGRLGTSMPIFLVFLLLNGAAYAAVDLFSGEKERKTIETLLTSLADRRSVVAGKFLAVFTVAEVSSILFVLSSMGSSMIGLTGGAGGESLSMSPGTALLVLLVTLPLGMFLSAVLVLVASHARTYREAQTLILPLTLLTVIPAALGVLPGISLESIVCLVPITNVSTAVRDALLGKFPVLPLLLVVLSNLAYAAWVLSRAARFLESEALILGRSTGAPLLFRGDRPLVRRVIVFYFAELLALYYVGSIIQAKDLMIGLLVTLWILLLLPSILFVRWHQIPIRTAFSLRRPRLGALLCGVFLAPAMLLLANALFQFQSRFVPLPEELFSNLEGLFRGEQGGLLIALFAVAVSPGICEELLFRGLILGRLQKGMAPWRAIVLGAFLFGLFHLSIYRILPTALLGIAAGSLVYFSGSIFPAMALHGFYNGLVVISERFGFLESLESMDLEVIGGSALLALVGIWLLFRGGGGRFRLRSS